jgi:hypothetical protein
LKRANPKNSSYHDYYIWRDPASGGKPPNNWAAIFGGSAWEYDESVGQYYLHLFYKEQVDLNWRNPVVYQEMMDLFRYWCDKGVDGSAWMSSTCGTNTLTCPITRGNSRPHRPSSAHGISKSISMTTTSPK